ncbi:MAG: hypothetical protein ACT4PU_06165 [Planctomycetota bacterium]
MRFQLVERSLLTFAFALAAGLVIDTRVAAQNVLLSWNGEVSQHDLLGASVANAGDIDGDGRNDVLVGRPSFGPSYNGAVFLYSGLDGSEILNWVSPVTQERMGFAVSGIHDVDGDDVRDVLIGVIQVPVFGGVDGPGYVSLFSGATGSLIRRFDGAATLDFYGCSIAVVGDLDADGINEFAIGARKHDTNATDAGMLEIRSGVTLEVLYTFYGSAVEDHLGHAVADAGDVDADGTSDIIVGMPSEYGWPHGGRARVYSGATGGLLHEFAGGQYDAFLGHAVDSAGDLDGDGHADVLVGMPGKNRAFVYSGATGAVLLQLAGKTSSEFGAAVAGLDDVNGDDIRDLLISAPGDDTPSSVNGDNTGSVFVVSGANGAVLMKLFGKPHDRRFGAALDASGDFDDDGVNDVVIGAPESNVPPLVGGPFGRAYVVSRFPWSGLAGGVATASGALPALGATGDLSGGELLELRVDGTKPSAALTLVVGLGLLGAPFKGGIMVPDPALMLTGLAASTDGSLVLSTAWPNAVPSGVFLCFQAWIVDASGPFGFIATPALSALTP